MLEEGKRKVRVGPMRGAPPRAVFVHRRAPPRARARSASAGTGQPAGSCRGARPRTCSRTGQVGGEQRSAGGKNKAANKATLTHWFVRNMCFSSKQGHKQGHKNKATNKATRVCQEPASD